MEERSARTDEVSGYLTEQRSPLARAVGRWLPAKGASSVEVDDVVQQAYVKAFRSLHKVRAKEASRLRAWLFRIARNLVIDESRRRGREPLTRHVEAEAQTPPLDCGPNVHGGSNGRKFIAREGAGHTLNGLMRLRRDEYMAMVLHDFQDVSWSTASLLLSRPSEKATRNLHLRGRTRIGTPNPGLA